MGDMPMAASSLCALLDAYIRAQPSRALGGVRALSGFEYQIRAYLADFAEALAGGDGLQQSGEGFAHALEVLSDHTRRDGDLTVCVQVKRTLTTATLADAAAEFVLVDEFLEGRLEPAVHAKVRYECAARGGDSTVVWDRVKLPSKVTSTRPGLTLRLDSLRQQGRLLSPRIERDPWWRLIASVYRQLDDPFAFAREALDLCLSRGLDAEGAARVRDGIAECFARRRTSAMPPYEYLVPEDFAAADHGCTDGTLVVFVAFRLSTFTPRGAPQGTGRRKKSKKDYSATTRYENYPISPTEFHWESQSVTRADSPTGRRYVNHERDGSHVLLFVRQRKKDSRGETMPYRFLGPVTYSGHEGERPMRIVWRLEHAMPAELFQEAKVVAG